MFYSHEILTSRESGVATVWLVATLGSKSGLKKVNRKAIIDVDVPKACETIITPQAPMALRLQSNLLYGVARVYSQQCGYILSDAQTAHNNMRALLEAVRTAEIDLNAGKARPDQLILHDDPAFFPDLFLPDLSKGLPTLSMSADDYKRRSGIISPMSTLSKTKGDEDSILGLVIPTSDVGGGGGDGGFAFSANTASSARRSVDLGGFVEGEKDDFDPDPGFIIDEDGNLILTEVQRTPNRKELPESLFKRIGSDSATSAHVRKEVREGLEAGQIQLNEAIDLELDRPRFGDEEFLLPDAEAFPELTRKGPRKEGLHRSSSTTSQEYSSHEDSSHEDSSHKSAAALVSRKRRVPKALPIDDAPELRNTDLARWNDNYLVNMAIETQTKVLQHATRLAKKNAAFWVGGSGIGGIGSFSQKTPLDIFAGDAFMKALTNVAASVAGRKRSRNEKDDDGSDSNERRVRTREVENQLGAFDDLPINGNADDAIMNGEEVEVGRDAQPALEDQSLPWNVSASVQGSVARGFGFPSSIGGFSASGGQPSSQIAILARSQQSPRNRRASRIASASPLQGRGLERYNPLELPTQDGDEDEFLGDPNVSNSKMLSDFQLYGPAAGVSTQTAAESQWVRATLDHESNNFLEFLKFEIAGKDSGIENEEERSVLFEELLPPPQHTNIVAAQALHHVLALATKGLIRVKQDEHYGPIALSLLAGV